MTEFLDKYNWYFRYAISELNLGLKLGKFSEASYDYTYTELIHLLERLIDGDLVAANDIDILLYLSQLCGIPFTCTGRQRQHSLSETFF